MGITKWFLTNVEDEDDVLTFIGHPVDVPGMRLFYHKKNGREKRLIEYQGKTYASVLRNYTQGEDVPCNHTGCQKAKSKVSECKCQCAGKKHGDFYELDLDEEKKEIA